MNRLIVRVLLFVLITSVFLGCVRTEDGVLNIVSLKGPEEVYLHHRTHEGAIVLTNYQSSNSTKLRTLAPKRGEEFIGVSFDPTKGLVGDYRCYGLGVVDVSKLLSEVPYSIQVFPINSLESSMLSFASEDSFNSKMSRKSSDSYGLSAKFLGWHIGAKKTFNSVFNQELSYDDQYVYGVVDVNCKYARYTLNEAPYVHRLIQHKYLEKDFRDCLYGLPLEKVFGSSSKYGSLIVTDFSTGGNARFLCEGKTLSISESSSREEAMERLMGISFSKDSLNTGGAGLGQSVRGNEMENLKSKFSLLRVSTKLQGGSYSMSSSFSPVRDMKNFSIDLSPWVASMNDPKTHVIADFERNGIKPITEYVSEINFKRHVEEDYYPNSLMPPYIEITWGEILPNFKIGCPPFTSPLPIYMALRTRHGDWILMRPIRQTDDNYWGATTEEEFNRKAQEISDQIKQYYDLDIKRSHRFVGYLNPLPHDQWPRPHAYASSIGFLRVVDPVITIPFYGFNHTNVFRCKHPNYYDPSKGEYMQYLCYTSGRTVKLAFAVYEPYLLDTYGIKSIFESAPEKNLTVEELSRYTIVGL